MTPELEACGWYVRTKRTDEDSAGWLIADCSAHRHGAEYARLFAASRDMLTALQEVLATPGLQSGLQAMCAAAIAKATGRDVIDVIKGVCDMAASKQVVALLPEQMQARLTAGVCISCGESLTNTGDRSAATAGGKHSVALASGFLGKAKGIEGAALFLVLRDENASDDRYGRILFARALIVGQDGIKADTFYMLNEAGEPVETE